MNIQLTTKISPCLITHASYRKVSERWRCQGVRCSCVHPAQGVHVYFFWVSMCAQLLLLTSLFVCIFLPYPSGIAESPEGGMLAPPTILSVCPNFRKAFLAHSQSTVEKRCMAHPAKLLLPGILKIANLLKTEMAVGCTVPALFPGFLYRTTNQVWLQSYSVCTPQTIDIT